MKTKNESYYGGFFWLAATSFIVPLFVAYAAFQKLSPTTKPTPNPDASGVDHGLWDYLLHRYVENGLVDYRGISKDYLFTTYLHQLAGCEPDKLSTREEKLALHCNAYNAFVIAGVINHKIHQNEKNVLNYTPKDIAARITVLDKQVEALKRRPKSDTSQIDVLTAQADQLRSQSQFFGLKEHVFANRTVSLDHLEHKTIRPTFKDPRVHVALVCAARSCPEIRAEAYEGSRVEKQLQDQSIRFANDTRYVRYDAASNTILLSPILNWYSDDWDSSGGYLAWLSERVDDQTLSAKLSEAHAKETNVKFNQYDWTLNSQLGSGGSGETSSSGFGSGSVPNE